MTITWAGVTGATGYDYQVGTGAVQSHHRHLGHAERACRRRDRVQAASHQQRRRERLHRRRRSSTRSRRGADPTGYPVKLHLDVERRCVKRLTATLTNTVTGATFTRQGRSQGNVTFANVPVGTYNLTVTGTRNVEFRAKTIVVTAPALTTDRSRRRHEDLTTRPTDSRSTKKGAPDRGRPSRSVRCERSGAALAHLALHQVVVGLSADHPAPLARRRRRPRRDAPACCSCCSSTGSRRRSRTRTGCRRPPGTAAARR